MGWSGVDSYEQKEEDPGRRLPIATGQQRPGLPGNLDWVGGQVTGPDLLHTAFTNVCSAYQHTSFLVQVYHAHAHASRPSHHLNDLMLCLSISKQKWRHWQAHHTHK